MLDFICVASIRLRRILTSHYARKKQALDNEELNLKPRVFVILSLLG
jgi:hypothetical protein